MLDREQVENWNGKLETECVNAHDMCYETQFGCPYCEVKQPPRDAETGRFVSLTNAY